MTFKISNVEHYVSPSGLNVDEILNAYGSSLTDMKKTMMDAELVHRNRTKGFQIELAEQLKSVLERHFRGLGGQLYSGSGYSPAMRETADVAVSRRGYSKKIFIEIEFRPNEHKDIVKFLIAYRNGSLDLGILIVAKDWEKINPTYHTMPIYDKCKLIITELRDECPMLLMGLDGQWLE